MRKPLEGLDHVAIAVENIEAALKVWVDLFGWVNDGVEVVADQQARVARLVKGPHAIELVEPHGEGSTVRKFLDRRGPGLHHVCFTVEGLDGMLTALKKAGVRLIDEAPRKGAHMRSIAFVHPRSADGVLVELSEPAFDPDRTVDPGTQATSHSGEGTAGDRLLTVAAVAELHGVDEAAVKAAIRAGSLRAEIVHGPSSATMGYVIRRTDALAWRPPR